MKLIRFVVAWVCAAFLACSVHAAPSPNPGWEAVESALAANDPVGARRIAESLAAAGDPDAINGLAVLVGQGVGGVRDEARANELIERAAKSLTHNVSV